MADFKLKKLFNNFVKRRKKIRSAKLAKFNKVKSQTENDTDTKGELKDENLKKNDELSEERSSPRFSEKTSLVNLRSEMEHLRAILDRNTSLEKSNKEHKSINYSDIEHNYTEARKILSEIKVLAFVGPSGTGKSTRAPYLAAKKGYEYIIDDGLLIHATRILAGTTAKKAKTRMESVRQAIFLDPTRSANMRRALIQHKPNKLMILATSDGMIEKICRNLWLNQATEIVRIGDVATEAEQRAARTSRIEGGHHTIPVASLEIKHEFSGYISDPVAALKRGIEKGIDVASNFLGSEREKSLENHDNYAWIKPEERTVVRPTFSSLGKYTISDEALKSLIEFVAKRAKGVASVVKSSIDNDVMGVTVSLSLALYYGYNVESCLKEAQIYIKKEIEKMTSINVLAVHLRASKLESSKEKIDKYKRYENRFSSTSTQNSRIL